MTFVNESIVIMDASYYVTHLGLLPHPEGGYYKETYRANGQFGDRDYSTAIYFLLEEGNFSAFHRIKSDEVWHFYAGTGLVIVEIDETGNLINTLLGNDLVKGQQYQYVVKAGRWFASYLSNKGGFALVGCTVSPGFDFKDFEMAKRKDLLKEYPNHGEIIHQLTRE